MRIELQDPVVTKLKSGFLHVRWSPECWCQLPPNYIALTIADEYIFNPSWNRTRINRWWATKEMRK